MADAGSAPEPPLVTYKRTVTIPQGVRVGREDLLTLAELVEAVAQSVEWSIRLQGTEPSGKTAEALADVLQNLTERPESVHLSAWKPSDDPMRVFGGVRVSLSNLLSSDVAIEGSDRDWVVLTEDRFAEEVGRRFSRASAWRPTIDPRITAVFAALGSGLFSGLVLAPLPLPPLIYTTVVSAMVAAVLFVLWSRWFLRAGLQRGVEFELGPPENRPAPREAWHQHPIAQTLTFAGGLASIIGLALYVLERLGIAP